jgi:MoxR-like ATPase
VLIDELDKADLDFPNDLLREIDRLEFEIPEIGEAHAVPPDRPDLRPIVFVTNNEEKSLPLAFLRRCIYLELEFPDDPDDPTLLDRVLAAHDVTDPAIAGWAIDVVRRIRKLDLTRKPGISELLDWARYVEVRKASRRSKKGLPAVGALVKHPQDRRQVEQLFQ